MQLALVAKYIGRNSAFLRFLSLIFRKKRKVRWTVLFKIIIIKGNAKQTTAASGISELLEESKDAVCHGFASWPRSTPLPSEEQDCLSWTWRIQLLYTSTFNLLSRHFGNKYVLYWLKKHLDINIKFILMYENGASTLKIWNWRQCEILELLRCFQVMPYITIVTWCIVDASVNAYESRKE